jgi:hypothetical protein
MLCCDVLCSDALCCAAAAAAAAAAADIEEIDAVVSTLGGSTKNPEVDSQGEC